MHSVLKAQVTFDLNEKDVKKLLLLLTKTPGITINFENQDLEDELLLKILEDADKENNYLNEQESKKLLKKMKTRWL